MKEIEMNRRPWKNFSSVKRETKLLTDLRYGGESKRKLVIAWLLAPYYLFLTCAHLLLIHAGNMSMKLPHCLYVTSPSLLHFSLHLTNDRSQMTRMNEERGKRRKVHYKAVLLYTSSSKMESFVTLCT